jgi:hypothetical protein
MLLLISAVAVPGFAQSYSCPDDNNGHCYGIVRFFAPGPPGTVGQFTGYATDVSIVPLNGGNGEINDEMWMGQFNNPACPGLNGNICWVEVGLSAGANAGGCSIPNNQTHFFWADNRPNGGFVCHDMGPVQAGDFGKRAWLIIWNSSVQLQPNSFVAQAGPPTGILGGLSTNNSMQPDHVDMGMELEGSSGANGPPAEFSANQFSQNPKPALGFQFLKFNGTVLKLGKNPPTAFWSSLPSSSGFGGDFRTSHP